MTNGELRKIAEAATPGPWFAYHAAEFPNDWRFCGVIPPGANPTIHRAYIGRLTKSHNPEISGNAWRATDQPEEADAQFIAAANPKTVLHLLDRIEELEQFLRLLGNQARRQHEGAGKSADAIG